MKEPYLSQFRQLVEAGSGKQDIHDSKEASGYAVTSPSANDAFVRREIERVVLHQRSLLPLLEEEIGKASSILDVGCGTGGTTVALALSERLGALEVIGVDPNRLSLQAAEVRAKGYGLSPDQIRFLPTSADQLLSFEDDHFDLTVCVSVLEFISGRNARLEFARELERLTKRDGYIFLATPSPFRLRELHSRRWLGDYRHKEGFPWASSPRQIRKMFMNCSPMALHGHYHRMARERFGRPVTWLPASAISPLIAWLAPWQRFLFRKVGLSVSHRRVRLAEEYVQPLRA
jgi:ubiquinone/menaquinone biosynthesis C-methylase UbiE